MKKIFLTLICVLFCAITFAQGVPQGINYQAVARDASGEVLMNQNLTIQLSIISDINTGNISWQETHIITTNDYGLFTAIIGHGATTGSGSSATFDAVDWGLSNHLLKVEVNDGSGYVDMGTSAFMSVPYALYSENPGADGATGPEGPFVTGTAGQSLRHDGTSWLANSLLFNDGTNVGIGTTAPSTLLHINHPTEARMRLTYAGNSGGLNIGSSALEAFVWNEENNSIVFATNNARRMTIAAGGNVGIGTATPYDVLDVNGNIRLGKWSDAGSRYIGYSDGDQSVANNPVAGMEIESQAVLPGQNYSQNLHFYTHHHGNTPGKRMTIQYDGNVGIGTTTPSSNLHVKNLGNSSPIGAAGNWAATIENNSDVSGQNGLFVANRWGGDASTIFEVGSYWSGFGEAYTPALTVKGDRNVGIGTATPSAKLDVVGTTELNGAVAIIDGSEDAGKVLTSDASGNASWTTPVSITGDRVFGNDFWHTSNDGRNRFWFDSNSTTHFGSADGYKWRNAADVAILTLQNDGNVGIGTETPVSKLQIISGGPPSTSGTMTTGLVVSNNLGTGVAINLGADPYYSWIQSSIATVASARRKLALNPLGGNVGINIAYPTTANLVIGGDSGSQGLDLSSANVYANMRVIHNRNSDIDKDLYLGYDSGATSSLHMYSNNSETMTVKAGKVGIGTAAPRQKLDVLGTTKTNALFVDGSHVIGSQGAYMMWNKDNGGGSTHFINQRGLGSGGFSFESSTTDDVRTNLVKILNNGNVGIGTTTPSSNLHVKNVGTSSPIGAAGNWGATIENNSDYPGQNGLFVANRWGNDASTIFEVGSYWSGTGEAYTPVLTVKGDRNIGIGETAPSAKLDVVGATELNGAVAIIDGSEGAGKVLTSDASGNASWTAPISITGDRVFAHNIWHTSNGGNKRFYFAGNSTTYFGSADGYKWRNAADVDILTLQNGGNVGIGTAAPRQKLDVLGTTKTNALFVDGSHVIGSQGAYMMWNKDIGGGYTHFINQRGGGAGGFRFQSSTTADVRTDLFSILNNGNVGIGTSSPTALLDVAGLANFGDGVASDQYISLKNSGGTWEVGNNDNFYINEIGNASGNYRKEFVIQPTTGNVGIGTETPTSKLMVVDNTVGHAMRVDNTNRAGSGIFIKINTKYSDNSNEFITFADGSLTNGAIIGAEFVNSLPAKPAFYNANGSGTAIRSWMWPSSITNYDSGPQWNSWFSNTVQNHVMEDLTIPAGALNIGATSITSALSLPLPGFTIEMPSYFPNIDIGLPNMAIPGSTIGLPSLPPTDINLPVKVPFFMNDLGNNPTNPQAAFFTAQQMFSTICWANSNGFDELITSDPLEMAFAIMLAKLKERCNRDGVEYTSSGADYAEWLPKQDTTAVFAYGEVVGVRNGHITKETQNVDQIMVISSRPIVVGNIPPPGEEHNYKRVGFMGQVLTLVQEGAKSGDYIIPSGHNDGWGMAVSPEDVTIEQIPLIVGKAWEDSESDVVDYVNVGVGLNTGEMAILMKKQVAEMSALKAGLKEQSILMKKQVAEMGTLKVELQNQSIKIEASVSRDDYYGLLKRLEFVESVFNVEAKK